MTKKQEPLLILLPNPTFIATVDITGHGAGETHPLEVEFRHMGKQAALAWTAALKGSKAMAADTLCEIVARIAGHDATPEIFNQLMDDFPRPFADLVQAWSLSLLKGREKNSPRPPAG